MEQKKLSISDQVFEKMKQMVLDEWEIGEKLPSEHALCDMFEVSRVTIRNALLRLNALGLIETHLGDGSYIKKLDASSNLSNLIPAMYLEDDFETIIEFRKEIESSACAIAAKKATKRDITKLRKLLTKMETLQDDLEELAKVDLEFHYCISTITKNSLMIKTYEVIHAAYTTHMKRMVTSMGGKWGLYYHSKIVDAIEKGDDVAARQLMYEHIQKNVEFIQGNVEFPE